MTKLNVKNVCEIIKACGSAGVSKLKFGDLELEFHIREEKQEITQTIPMYSVSHTYQDDNSQGPESDSVSPELLQKQEAELKQQEVSEMLITDPAAYEELLFSGALTNEDDRGTESGL